MGNVPPSNKDYVPPSMEELSASIAVVKKKYMGKNRLHTINLLDFTQKTFSHASWENLTVSKDVLYYAALGFWTLSREGIPRAPHWWQRYHVLKPDYVEWYCLSKGSSLYSILSTEMKIDEEKNPLDDKTKLTYLENLYYLICNPDPAIQEQLAPWKKELAQQNIPFPKLKKRIEAMMGELFNSMPGEIYKILHAIRTDKAMHEKMAHFWENLKNNQTNSVEKSYFSAWFSKETAQDKFMAQMAEAINDKLPVDDQKDTLNRPQRIRMGALLFIMESIKSQCWSWQDNELYKLCKDALNNEIKKFPHLTEKECLNAFRNLLRDHEVLNGIEDYGKQLGDENHIKEIDSKIPPLEKELKAIIKDISSRSTTSTNWPATRALGRTGELLFAAPFWGIGTFVSLTVGESNGMVQPQVQVGNALNRLGIAMLGLSYNYYALMAVRYIFMSALMRGFGKTFEYGGKKIGYGLFGSAGFLIDCFRNLFLYNIFLYENCDNPVLMKNINIQFLKTLVRLPPCVLKSVDQEHLEKLLKEKCEEELESVATNEHVSLRLR